MPDAPVGEHAIVRADHSFVHGAEVRAAENGILDEVLVDQVHHAVQVHVGQARRRAMQRHGTTNVLSNSQQVQHVELIRADGIAPQADRRRAAEHLHEARAVGDNPKGVRRHRAKRACRGVRGRDDGQRVGREVGNGDTVGQPEVVQRRGTVGDGAQIDHLAGRNGIGVIRGQPDRRITGNEDSNIRQNAEAQERKQSFCRSET